MNTNLSYFLNLANNLRELDLSKLSDKFILIKDGDLSYLAKVLEIKKESLRIKTIPSPRVEIEEKEIEIKVYHVGSNSISVSHVDEVERNYSAIPVYVRSPHQIFGSSTCKEFSLHENDSDLEHIINKFGLNNFFENAKQYLEIIHSNFKIPESNLADNSSLGLILKSGFAHCRHRSALIYIIGKSQGLDVHIEYSMRDQDGETHSFLVWNNNSEEIIIDPTFNIIGNRDKVSKELKKLGVKFDYYHNTNVMSINLEY